MDIDIEKISGRIVTHEKDFFGTIFFSNKIGLIQDVVSAESESLQRSYSLTDCVIFPGFGDIHIHAREDESQKQIYKEDFQSVSHAALNGGVVHIADMPNNPIPPIDDDSYKKKDSLAQKKSPILITLYAGIGPNTKPLSRKVPYKVFMGPSIGELYFKTNEELEDVMRHYRGENVSFHCEDPIILENHKGEKLHEDRRPPLAEITATEFAIYLIEKYDLKGKLCHYSTKEGLKKIIEAKKRHLSVTCEVTPTHLFFDRSMITSENFFWFQMNPPLREKEDKEALLNSLIQGDIDYLATDHAPHTIEEKKKGISGISQLDTYSLFVTWLINEKKVPLKRIAEVCAKNPGDFVNGFLPEKYGKGFGRIEKGYSASFTILNLREKTIFQKEMIKSKSGWSPYEGFSFPGKLEAVYFHGRKV
ncbi:MAG: amidohydrolase family protein [Leptospiraceae bacterium]|nr:amidohydrolase family protein [Leptospiraceae bacterium]MCK6381484.1 amidohydrolase family protein [Leptospiraceae bacterium]NUM40199.1 amidohydrolase family protein [Leptospiraceae bacterium]